MEPTFICCLILMTSLVEVHSETKVVRRGESVLLFANVTADSPDNEVHLYINGVKDNTLIASWKFEKERFTMVSRTYHNILMDVDRNILIYNVNENYIGKYSLYNSSRPAIELIVLDSSQIKSENPSQNTLLWIVCFALAIVVSAFILYVAYTKKWGKKIRPCRKHRHGKHPTPKETEEGIELVSSEKPQDAEEDMNYLRVMARLDVLDAEVKKLKAERDQTNSYTNRLGYSWYTGTLFSTLPDSFFHYGQIPTIGNVRHRTENLQLNNPQISYGSSFDSDSEPCFEEECDQMDV